MTIASKELNSFNKYIEHLKIEHNIKIARNLTNLLQGEHGIYLLSTVERTFIFNILVATKFDSFSINYNNNRSVLYAELLTDYLGELSNEVLWHIIDSISIFHLDVAIEKYIIKNIIERFDNKYKKKKIVKVFNYV